MRLPQIASNAFHTVIWIVGLIFLFFMVWINAYAIQSWLSFDSKALGSSPAQAAYPAPTPHEASAAYLKAWRADWLERQVLSPELVDERETHRDARAKFTRVEISDCLWLPASDAAMAPESRPRIGQAPSAAYRCQIKVSFATGKSAGGETTRSGRGCFFRDDAGGLHYSGQFPV
jgi:hypothetical protein